MRDDGKHRDIQRGDADSRGAGVAGEGGTPGARNLGYRATAGRNDTGDENDTAPHANDLAGAGGITGAGTIMGSAGIGGSGDIVQSTRSGPTSSGLNADRAVRQNEADEREGRKPGKDDKTS